MLNSSLFRPSLCHLRIFQRLVWWVATISCLYTAVGPRLRIFRWPRWPTRKKRRQRQLTYAPARCFCSVLCTASSLLRWVAISELLFHSSSFLLFLILLFLILLFVYLLFASLFRGSCSSDEVSYSSYHSLRMVTPLVYYMCTWHTHFSQRCHLCYKR